MHFNLHIAFQIWNLQFMHITHLSYFWVTSHPYTNIYINDITALNRYSNKITASFPVCCFASLSFSSSVRICRSQFYHYRIYIWNGKTVQGAGWGRLYLELWIWPQMLKVCPVRLHHHPSCWELQPTWGSHTHVRTHKEHTAVSAELLSRERQGRTEHAHQERVIGHQGELYVHDSKQTQTHKHERTHSCQRKLILLRFIQC